MKRCQSCGMIIELIEDFPNLDTEGKYCARCANERGDLKDFDEVLASVSGYMSETNGFSDEVARDVALQILKHQPAWEPIFKKEEEEKMKKRNVGIIAVICAVALLLTGTVYGVGRFWANKTVISDDIFKTTTRKVGNTEITEFSTELHNSISNFYPETDTLHLSFMIGKGGLNYFYDMGTGTGQTRPDDPLNAIAKSDGKKIVWDKYSPFDETSDVKACDVTTGNLFDVCTAPKSQWKSNVCGDFVVWHDLRNAIKRGEEDIYAYSISEKKEYRLSFATGSQGPYAIMNDRYIVWYGPVDDKKEFYGICVFDKNTKERKILSKSKTTYMLSGISGSKVYWWEQQVLADKKTKMVVVGKDIITDKEFRFDLVRGMMFDMTKKYFALAGCAFSDRWLAYQGKLNDGLYLYDWENDKTYQLSENTIEPYMRIDPQKDDYPGMIVWCEYKQSTSNKVKTICYKMLDQLDKPEKFITESGYPPSANQDFADVYNGKIVWKEIFKPQDKNLDSMTNLYFWDYKVGKNILLETTNTDCLPSITNGYVAWTLEKKENFYPPNIIMQKTCFTKIP